MLTQQQKLNLLIIIVLFLFFLVTRDRGIFIGVLTSLTSLLAEVEMY